MPSARGTRTASPCPPSIPLRAQKPPCSHAVCRPSRQKSQVPSDQANGATTRSPFLTLVTSDPASSTMPMNSWPMRDGPSAGDIEW